MEPFRFGFGEATQAENKFSDNSQPVVSAVAQPVQPLNSLMKEKGQTDVECTPERFNCSDAGAQALLLHKVHIDSTDAALKLGVSDVNVSDLVPGTYEGGFKLWEGARDLTRVVCLRWHSEAETRPEHSIPGAQLLPEKLEGKRVLELGCGHGLPGIACLLAGAEVLFHDLNMCVLAHATAPNVLKNIEQHEGLRPQAHFVDGDFQSAAEMISASFGPKQCDLILTAESIYNSNSAQQLLDACDTCLTENGSVLLAAKSYYFGVGGSVASFKERVQTDGRFIWEVLSRIDDGTNNVREVLVLSRSTVT